MTPTTLQDRVIAYNCFDLPGQPMSVHMGTSYLINDLLKAVEALTKERDELRIQIDIQAGSIEAVQSANQRLAANHKECVRCLGEALQDTTNLAVERDALAASRYAYATEFSLDEEGQPDVGSIHQNIRALKAAAKLALEALERLHEYASEEWHATPKLVNACRTASLQIAEIRKAGVQ